ncbi:hypothetical protein N658DRAFT_496455 [Parathielavia hyrcaniae]|uniref:Uncharacterized protein n=1 Tax=Parathielavia hyrcaniae TaxID=113614 RepID=A0AAN6Q059_9PEZI|nr:hypothetical protein N658DRAFT_496455 [Parathielavia hyrcaniae]
MKRASVHPGLGKQQEAEANRNPPLKAPGTIALAYPFPAQPSGYNRSSSGRGCTKQR